MKSLIGRHRLIIVRETHLSQGMMLIKFLAQLAKYKLDPDQN